MRTEFEENKYQMGMRKLNWIDVTNETNAVKMEKKKKKIEMDWCLLSMGDCMPNADEIRYQRWSDMKEISKLYINGDGTVGFWIYFDAMAH